MHKKCVAGLVAFQDPAENVATLVFALQGRPTARLLIVLPKASVLSKDQERLSSDGLSTLLCLAMLSTEHQIRREDSPTGSVNPRSVLERGTYPRRDASGYQKLRTTFSRLARTNASMHNTRATLCRFNSTSVQPDSVLDTMALSRPPAHQRISDTCGILQRSAASHCLWSCGRHIGMSTA